VTKKYDDDDDDDDHDDASTSWARHDITG